MKTAQNHMEGAMVMGASARSGDGVPTAGGTRHWWLLGGALLWFYTLGHYLHGLLHYRGDGDFRTLLFAVHQWLLSGHFQVGYWYPPFFYLLNIPFVVLDESVASWIMLVINQALLAGCFGLLAEATATRVPRRLWWWVLLPLALNYRPLLLLLSMAKIEMLQLLFLLGGLVTFQRRQYGLAGILTALAGMLKPMPLLFVLYFAWKREWRVVRAWTLTVAFILMISGLAVGFPAVWEYFSTLIQPRGSNASYWYEDQSLMGVTVRLFHRVRANKFFLDSAEVSTLSLAVGWVLKVIVLGWLGVLLRPQSSASTERVWGEWSLVSVGMLLLSPVSRDYYAVFLIPAYLLLAITVWRSGGWSRSPACWLGLASYLLVGQGFPLGIIRKLPPLVPGVDNFHTYLHYGIPTLGYLLLLMAWMVMLERGRVVGPAHVTQAVAVAS